MTVCTFAAQRGLWISAGASKDPRSDPNYRRGSSSGGRRQRTDTGKSQKGASVEGDKRRRGRPAWMRSPDDTPLRDGNRDRLMGLLTDRATRTLEHSLEEGNPTLHIWLSLYLQQNGIPKDGNWSDVSGENFLRTLLTQPIEEISGSFSDEEPQFANASPIGGDPRLVAQRIMDYRHAIAKEWIDELKAVQEENKLLLSESLMSSLAQAAAGGSTAAAGEQQAQQQPRSESQVDDSAAGSDD
ncbi:hypothetical protein ABPG75_013761 [Micractinium tetrahymenae]